MKQSRKLVWRTSDNILLLWDASGYVRAVLYFDRHTWWGVGPLGTNGPIEEHVNNGRGAKNPKTLRLRFERLVRSLGY